MTPREFDFIIGVDELGNQKMSGVPIDVWQAFSKQAEKHFPDAGENAPFYYLSEIMVSALTDESFVLTGIPKGNRQALNQILNRVNWYDDQLLVYLLKSAIQPNMLRIVSFNDPEAKQQDFGTILVTGLRKSTFDKLETQMEVSLEDFLGILFNAAEMGDVDVTPKGIFRQLLSNRP